MLKIKYIKLNCYFVEVVLVLIKIHLKQLSSSSSFGSTGQEKNNYTCGYNIN